jgi:hypothetical protein
MLHIIILVQIYACITNNEFEHFIRGITSVSFARNVEFIPETCPHTVWKHLIVIYIFSEANAYVRASSHVAFVAKFKFVLRAVMWTQLELYFLCTLRAICSRDCIGIVSHFYNILFPEDVVIADRFLVEIHSGPFKPIRIPCLVLESFTVVI